MTDLSATRTVTAIFDGQVLCPDDLLDLEPNVRYVITIAPQPETATRGDAWDVLEQMSGTIEAPPDWAAEHDHYLYGAPKRPDA
ncbi:MAG TPA: hypothetical protein PKC13_24275 [Blastocatellia bacterium]|nr:hypothetical protein [Blastocatellia bacterium]HMX28725.1 hypothetical protein [Blastocatellia bacterium]HMY72589.1 hypothetical protein [Blastocatellia bacterium]